MTAHTIHPRKRKGQRFAEVAYSLPQRSRVRLRIVPEGRWALVLRTLIEWEIREAGDHIVKWDGRDSSGNKLNVHRCCVILETESVLAPATVRSVRRSGKELNTIRGHYHGLHDPRKCHELKVKVLNPLAKKKLSGRVKVAAKVDRRRRGYGSQHGHGVRYYMDYQLIYENEEETGPSFKFELDTTKFGNGERTLSVSCCDHNGHVGTDSIVINIQNHPEPPAIKLPFIEELACCGPKMRPRTNDLTSPNTDDDQSPDQCVGSAVSLGTGAFKEEHAPFITRGGLDPGFDLLATYNSSWVSNDIPIVISSGWYGGDGGEFTWRVQLLDRTWTGTSDITAGVTWKTLAAFWDARDASGTPVPPGRYDYTYDVTWRVYTWEDAPGYGNAKEQVWSTYSFSGSGSVNVMTGLQSPLGNLWRFSADTRLFLRPWGDSIPYIDWLDERGNLRVFSRGLDGSYQGPPGFYATLAVLADGYQVRMKNGLTYTFDSNGRITRRTSRQGNVLLYNYQNGRLTSMTDPGGRQVLFTYNGAGLITAITRPDGTSYTYEYDGTGNLVRVIDPAGGTTGYTYDAKSLMTGKACPRGLTSAYSYTVPASNPQWGYQAKTRIAGVTDPLGNVTRYEYGVDFDENAGGETAVFEWDVYREWTKIVFPNGNSHTYYLNRYGAPVGEKNGVGGITRYSYDADRQVASVYDALGRGAAFTYDDRGNPALIDFPHGASDSERGQIARIFEPSFGQVVSYTDARNNTWSFAHDAKGNLIRATDSLGADTRYTRDGRGFVVELTNALGGRALFGYDQYGNVISLTDPIGRTVACTYDVLGNLKSLTNAGGFTYTFDYDLCGLLTKVTDPLGRYLSYEYDAAGNRIACTDANGHVTRQAVASCDLIVEQVDALGRSVSYQYDGNKNLIQRTDPRGNVVRYEYDTADRLVKTVYPGGKTVERSYDAVNNLIALVSADYQAEYAYDNQNGLVQATYSHAGKTVARSFDAHGNRTTSGIEGELSSYEYDALNRPIMVVGPDGGRTEFIYDALGRVIERKMPNGIGRKYEYDGAGRLSRLVDNDADNDTLLERRYTYDAQDNPLSVVDEKNRLISYTYDALGRLTSAVEPDGTVEAYTYDAVGNRLTLTRAGNTTDYVYDDANQLLQVGGDTLRYDLSGNVVSLMRGGKKYKFAWDHDDRLERITFADGGSMGFEYDPAGRRNRMRAQNGEETRYLYDGPNLLEQDTGSEITAFINAPGIDDVIASRTATNVLFHHADAIGSLVGLSDTAGRLRQDIAYSHWGLPSATMESSRPQGFTGREYVAAADLGLYYYRTRYYDPATGRFLSKDKLPWQVLRPGHEYIYVNNEPARFRDPLGLSPQMPAWLNTLFSNISYYSINLSALTGVGGDVEFKVQFQPSRLLMAVSLCGGVGVGGGALMAGKMGFSSGDLTKGWDASATSKLSGAACYVAGGSIDLDTKLNPVDAAVVFGFGAQLSAGFEGCVTYGF